MFSFGVAIIFFSFGILYKVEQLCVCNYWNWEYKQLWDIDQENPDSMLLEVYVDGRIIVRDLGIRSCGAVETFPTIVMCYGRMFGGHCRPAWREINGWVCTIRSLYFFVAECSCQPKQIYMDITWENYKNNLRSGKVSSYLAGAPLGGVSWVFNPGGGVR
jgi:hypothetical protein